MTVDHVTKEFGGLVAVNDVSLEIPKLGIVSLIGPNGAGKTTLFNMLTGLYKPTTGRILLGERNISRARPDIITSLGVARTFQNIRLFGAMTARRERDDRPPRADARGPVGLDRAPAVGAQGGARGPRARPRAARLRRAAAPARSISSRPQLSYGDQRRVEIARALASEPTLLLLDEPTAGMNPQESARADRVHAQAPRRAQADDPADRARHEGRDGRLRARHRARPRREDRRGGAGRGARRIRG